MKFPTDPMAQNSLFIEALCADWRDAGTVTRVTPKADRVLEISRQFQSKRDAGAANNRPATDQ